MNLPGTEMHMVTFTITVIEIFLVFFQIIYFLQRPSDRQRLWYLILLVLLIQYNIAGGLFPDPDLTLPVYYQNLYSYFTGIIMTMYFAFYFYKAFDLKKLRFMAYYGSFIYVGLPYLVLYVVPYSITGSADLASKLVVVVPFIYGIAMCRAIFISFKRKINEFSNKEDFRFQKENMIAVYIASVFWLTLGLVTYFGGSQVLEHSLTNAGFLVMTVTYIRSIVHKSKMEFIALKNSKNNLIEINTNLQDTVKEKTVHLEKLIQQKTNTFINLAHELKTPITLTQNYIYDYEKKYGSNKELEIIKSNSNKIARDIVNFFDLEKFNKGIDVYENNKVTDFSKALAVSVTLFTSLAAKKNIEITSSIEKDLYIRAAPNGIERIINNLMENAVKYTGPNKSIFVKLASDGHKVVFTVYDEGIGIAQEKQKNIFEPYYQIYTKKKNVDGLGMGLSIVKQIVKYLGGEIVVDSEPGRGSTFTIILNRHSLSNKEMVSDYETSNANYIEIETTGLGDVVTDQERPFIMVVEDNLTLLKLLRDKLSKHYNVYTAVDGENALQKLEQKIHLDLIVSDIMMDAIDGFELYKHVSKMQKYTHLPFIFLTAKAGPQDKIEGLKMGAIDYIEKPFRVEMLKEKIDSILSTLSKQRTALINQAYLNLNGGRVTADAVKNCFDSNCNRLGFTAREKEICGLLKKGITYPQMGEELNIATTTVKKHVSNIFEKAGTRNKVQLIKALDIGIKA